MAKGTPQEATIGPTIKVTLSPTPPVECLSTLTPGILLKSKTSPLLMNKSVKSKTSSSSSSSSYSHDSSSYDTNNDVYGDYVGNSNTHKFHTSYCSWADNIKSGNQVSFSSRQEAIDSGYSPCGHCNP